MTIIHANCSHFRQTETGLDPALLDLEGVKVTFAYIAEVIWLIFQLLRG